MLTHKELETFLLAFDHTRLDFPFGEGTSAYKVKNPDTDEEKLFAIIADGSDPLRVSLKCDPLLAKSLREKYESIQPGYHLNKKHWNTVVCSGQLSDDEVKDLARHSYELVTASLR